MSVTRTKHDFVRHFGRFLRNYSPLTSIYEREAAAAYKRSLLQDPELYCGCGQSMERPSANDQGLTDAADVPPTTLKNSFFNPHFTDFSELNWTVWSAPATWLNVKCHWNQCTLNNNSTNNNNIKENSVRINSGPACRCDGYFNMLLPISLKWT